MLILAAAAIGVGIAAVQLRKSEPAPDPNESAVPTPPGESADPEPSSITSTQPEPKSRGRNLEPRVRDKAAEAIRTWQFDAADGSALRPAPDLHPDAAELIANWHVRRLFANHARASEASIPEKVHKIVLENGNTLWAQSIEEKPQELRAQLLSRSIKTTLARRTVKKVVPMDRETYFALTRSEYEQELKSLTQGSPVDLLRAFALADQRGDLRRYEDLFTRWRDGGGTKTLLPLLASNERKTLEEALAGEGAPEAPAVASNVERRRPETTRVTFESLSELETAIQRMRKKVRTNMPEKQRNRFVQQVNSWEDWLHRGNHRDAQYVRELRRQLQLLRLDLLKGSKF